MWLRFFFEENRYFFKQEEIEKYIADYLCTLPNAQTDSLQRDSRAVLKSIEVQHGLLIERAPEIYSFSHLTFQEYFTTKWFCERIDWAGLAAQVGKKQWREVFLLTIEMLQTSADCLLNLMKKEVDALIDTDEAIDEKLQQFLKRVSQSSLSGKTSYKPVFVRAFYLNPARERVFVLGANYNLSLIFDFKRIRDFNSFRHTADGLDYICDLAHSLFRIIRLDNDFFAKTLTLSSCVDFKHIYSMLSQYTYGNTRAISRDRSHRDAICKTEFMKFEQGLVFDFSPTVYRLISRLTNNMTRSIRWHLQSACNSTQNSELKLQLNTFINQLPELPSDTDTYSWWHYNGQSWTEELKILMFKHCHIGRRWQLSAEQQELLNQYYDASTLLVNCLNSGCAVSNEVRQKIEETLLLPIDEIKKRQQQVQVTDVAGE